MERERAILRRELLELALTMVLVWAVAPFTWKVWSIPIGFLLLVGILFHYRPQAMAWRVVERELRSQR